MFPLRCPLRESRKERLNQPLNEPRLSLRLTVQDDENNRVLPTSTDSPTCPINLTTIQNGGLGKSLRIVDGKGATQEECVSSFGKRRKSAYFYTEERIEPRNATLAKVKKKTPTAHDNHTIKV